MKRDHVNSPEAPEGLFSCQVCGCAEGELPRDCPGYQVDASDKILIFTGHLEFLNGRWWKLACSHKRQDARTGEVTKVNTLLLPCADPHCGESRPWIYRVIALTEDRLNWRWYPESGVPHELPPGFTTWWRRTRNTCGEWFWSRMLMSPQEALRASQPEGSSPSAEE